MIYIFIATSLVSFAVGMAVHHLATNDKIDRLKEDAKASQKEQAIESFEAGYRRGYSDKNARRPQKELTDMTAILDLVS